MDTNQLVVFEALRRGRIICPFRGELESMKARSASGPVTTDEAHRMGELGKAYRSFEVLDTEFHSAMEKQDYSSATETAKKAIAVAKSVFLGDA